MCVHWLPSPLIVHRAPHYRKSLHSGIWITIKLCQNHTCTLYCTGHSLAQSSRHSGVWITIKPCQNHPCTLYCTVHSLANTSLHSGIWITIKPCQNHSCTLYCTVHSLANSSLHSGKWITIKPCQNHSCTLYCTVHSLAHSSRHSGIKITFSSCQVTYATDCTQPCKSVKVLISPCITAQWFIPHSWLLHSGASFTGSYHSGIYSPPKYHGAVPFFHS